MVRLNEQLALVDTEVAARLPREEMQMLEDDISGLVDSGVSRRALAVGDIAPDFELPDRWGAFVKSADLRARGPLILSFFQGSWSPYCMVTLKGVQEQLPELRKRGAEFVAISPEAAEYSRNIPQQLNFQFPILGDDGNRVSSSFGLVYTLSPAVRPIYARFGVDVAARNADRTWDIPVPATYMIAGDGRIVRAFVEADFRRRMAAEMLLAWIDEAEQQGRAIY